MLASPPASVSSFAPSLPDSITDDGCLHSRPSTPDGLPSPSWAADDDADGADDGDGWTRAESVVRGIRRLIEDFPAPLQPKRKATRAADVESARSPDGIVDGLRLLVEELRASMQRMDAIRARTIDLVGDTLFAPSRTPSPTHSPCKPLAPVLSPAPILHHPVPEHIIPRPTYRSSSTVSAVEDDRPLPAFAPTLETPPPVASPDGGGENNARGRPDPWALLPTNLDLNLDGCDPSPAGKRPSPRSPLPSFVLGPQPPAVEKRVDVLYRTPGVSVIPASIAAPPPPRIPTPPPLSFEEFPPLGAATRSDKKAASRSRGATSSTQDSFTSFATAGSTTVGPSEESNESSSPPTSSLPVTPVAQTLSKLSVISAKAPPFVLPTSKPHPAFQHQPSQSVGNLTSSQRHQLMATAAPFVSQQRFSHQQPPYGLPPPQQMQPFFSPAHNSWIYPAAPATNGQPFVLMPQPAVGVGHVYGGPPGPFVGNGPGWGGGMAGLVTNGPIPGHAFPQHGYDFSPTPLQPWLHIQRPHEQQAIHHGHGWRPFHSTSGPPPQYSPPAASSTRISSGGQSEQQPVQPQQQQQQRNFPTFLIKPSSRSTDGGGSAPTSMLASGSSSDPSTPATPSPHQLPPPPSPGATSPPPMPAHMLPAYLRLYASAFPADAAVRIRLADQQLAAMRNAGRDTGQIIPRDDRAGWIDTPDPSIGGGTAVAGPSA